MGCNQLPKEKSEGSIQRIVKYRTKLNISSVNLSQSLLYKKGSDNFYHLRLTDDDVNQMDRLENQRLEFFKMNEAEKLTLSESASSFFNEYKDRIKGLLTS